MSVCSYKSRVHSEKAVSQTPMQALGLWLLKLAAASQTLLA